MLARMKDAVAAAKKTATKPAADEKDLKALDKKLARLDATLSRHKAIKLGIEGTATEELETRAATVKVQRSKAAKMVNHANRYLKLSLEPLTWRDSQKRPRLVCFSLDSPKVEFRSTRHVSGWNGSVSYNATVQPALPDAMRAKYQDVLNMVQRKARGLSSYTLFCAFNALLPLDVKEAAVKAKKEFEKVFVIAEPANWTEQARAVVKRDPLLVGWDGMNLWLIKDFDTTTVEEAMVFTDKDKK